MKKIILPALVMLAGAVGAADVATTNLLGITVINSKRVNTICAIPWAAYDADPSTAGNITVADIVNLANLTPGDLLYALSDNGTAGSYEYYAWKVNDEGNGWDKVGTVVVKADGTYESVKTPSATEQQLQRGDAFWLHRQNPTNNNVAVPFYLNGQFKSGTVSTTVTEGSFEAPKATLIASPGISAFSIDTLLSTSGLIAADRIIIMEDDGTETMYRVRTVDSAKVWQKRTITSGTETWPTVTGVTVAAGQGFWYLSFGGTPQIKW